MSFNEILQIEQQRIRRERVVLQTIYDRMKNRINNSVKVKSKECIYTIPEFIPGYPLTDINKTMKYLLDKLKREGFIVLQLTQLDLYVTWDPTQIKKLDQLIKENQPNQEPVYSKITNKPFWDPNEENGSRKSVDKNLLDKQLERAKEDFINSLVISKKSEKR